MGEMRREGEKEILEDEEGGKMIGSFCGYLHSCEATLKKFLAHHTLEP